VKRTSIAIKAHIRALRADMESYARLRSGNVANHKKSNAQLWMFVDKVEVQLNAFVKQRLARSSLRSHHGAQSF